MGSDEATEASTQTKVGRLIVEYGLGEEYGEYLERAWTAGGSERKSLRDLATEFNRELLATAMTDAGVSTIDGEVDNVFRVLTSEEVTAGMRTDAQRRLERNGVDVEQLERDFVTYQAIRSYLQTERGAEYREDGDTDRVQRTADSIGRLRSRLLSVTESNLEQLKDGDEITLGEFQLFTSVDVLCDACDSRHSVAELLERGGCNCLDDEQ